MKKIFLFLAVSCFLVAPVMASELLDEVNAKFTYRGEPIHPRLIHEFSNWLSDGVAPVITTVDLTAAFNTDEYPQSEIKSREDWWYSEKEEMDGDIRLYESFDYHWLGKMSNNIHVVETGSSGGGSGFFMDLMFIKFSEGEILVEEAKEKQLLMSIMGIYSLGDRYDGDIKVYEDRVFIPASKNQYGGGSTEKDIEIKLPL